MNISNTEAAAGRRKTIRQRSLPMMLAQSPIAYARRHRARFVKELADFVRFPSVSTQVEHTGDVRRCALWLVRHLQKIGLKNVRLIRTAGHPVVYADWLQDRRQPTILIYGHYDVQPAEPLEEWTSQPFHPTLRDNALYGRGASDDKGQMMAHLKAVEAYLKTRGALPVNVKCVFEGEEEIGSASLISLIEKRREEFSADAVVLSDMRLLAPNRPAITYSLRGALSLELEVRGQKTDLHSGNFGGAVHNPLQALCEMIARLHDAGGRIAIPGFYERVRNLSAAERGDMARAGLSDTQILKDAGAEIGWGEKDYTLYERTTARPALIINGITGGYQGAGVKAVIPSHAAAKINFRLVPFQDPLEIAGLFRRFVKRIAPPALQVETRTLVTAKPVLVSRRHPAMRAAADAYRKGFGRKPVFLRTGGTIPAVSVFQDQLAAPTVMMGFALPDDAIHAPNEKFRLANFFRGIETCIHFMAEVGKRLNQTN